MTTETSDSSKDVKFDHWCIVELMGHQRIAGRVTEQNVFGTALMRVDVPEVDGHPGFTKFYGASAIYAVTPVDERVARAVASSLDTRPIETWRLQRLMAPSQPTRYDGDEFSSEDKPYIPDPNGHEEDSPFDYDADCASCLAGRAHTVTEHESHLQRSGLHDEDDDQRTEFTYVG